MRVMLCANGFSLYHLVGHDLQGKKITEIFAVSFPERLLCRRGKCPTKHGNLLF